ncbi:hypothetical protein PVK06_009950 [Gossypium arboreum]|uniref:Uncharacterized protein n=1 Tax=Gossypium arboreum TaxID=29729 RepID=A0ABR0QQ99_GOSAR|nr:hypothetical protein PVK06_009950 [Gossypium arboreum]
MSSTARRGIRDSVPMAGDGVKTRLKKDVTILQQEFQKMQGEFLQLHVKINVMLKARLQGFKDDFKGEIRSELNTLRSKLHGLFEHIAAQDREKRVMGNRPPL